MYYPKAKQTLMSLAVASACAAFMPAYAQEVASTPGAAATADQEATSPSSPAGVQTVVVTGLRASLES